MAQTVRTHVVMPAEMVKEIDEVFGGRNRSRFIVEAVEKELRRLKLRRSLDAFQMEDGEFPPWDTTESTIEWVRELRRTADRFPAGGDWSEDDPLPAGHELPH